MRYWLTFTVALLPALTQATEGKIPREGFDLWYRTYGAGRPMVILSGGPGLDCDYLEPVAQELAKRNQVILVELRGTGHSRPPVVNAETVSVKACLADLEALRDHLKIERWTVVGHSTGGSLGLFYAAAHPASVEALVLISSGHVVWEPDNAVTDNALMRLCPSERQQLEELGTSTAGTPDGTAGFDSTRCFALQSTSNQLLHATTWESGSLGS
jgi:proline iminopeptidase